MSHVHDDGRSLEARFVSNRGSSALLENGSQFRLGFEQSLQINQVGAKVCPQFVPESCPVGAKVFHGRGAVSFSYVRSCQQSM